MPQLLQVGGETIVDTPQVWAHFQSNLMPKVQLRHPNFVWKAANTNELHVPSLE